MHVLAVEPFYGSSHRAFLDSVIERSHHDWTLVTGHPRHWKWRMRSSPLVLAQATEKRLEDEQRVVDVIFCTDMLDLPQWRGLMRGTQWIGSKCPSVAYFHENQWTYPTAPKAREDFHYGYTNLLTAIAANVVWFNSHFHQDSFLKACERFLNRMPDSILEHDLGSLRSKSSVIHAGFEPLPTVNQVADHDTTHRPIVLGWVARWEDDKRPDQFDELLKLLEARGVAFELILLGARPRKGNASLEQIRDRLGDRIRYDGFAENEMVNDSGNETGDSYGRWLSEMDVVVSTADHEFFGIAICEAVWAGAIPVVPNRLSYPELAIDENLYDSIEQAAALIESIADESIDRRRDRIERSRGKIADYRMSELVPKLDDRLNLLLG
jgi:glycosyltransferase involved in cell wall biosynthesis